MPKKDKEPDLNETLLALEGPLAEALADESNGSSVIRTVWLNFHGSVSHLRDALRSESSLERP